MEFMEKDAISIYQRRIVMRFNVEFKIPQCDAVIDGDTEVDIDTLVEIHKMFRAWLKIKESNPTEPYPGELHTLFNSILGFYLSMDSMFVLLNESFEEQERI